jgi:hypothetical protein
MTLCPPLTRVFSIGVAMFLRLGSITVATHVALRRAKGTRTSAVQVSRWANGATDPIANTPLTKVMTASSSWPHQALASRRISMGTLVEIQTNSPWQPFAGMQQPRGCQTTHLEVRWGRASTVTCVMSNGRTKLSFIKRFPQTGTPLMLHTDAAWELRSVLHILHMSVLLGT